MIDNRKKRILQAIIDEYIFTAEPVSSSFIANNLGFSSATIRNEMCNLEEDGFLDKPYSSSGRIPSNKGYRLYVDELIIGDNISLDEINYINSKLNQEQELIKIIANILSEITNYTTISINPLEVEFNLLKNMFNFPEFKKVDIAQSLINMIDEKDILIDLLSNILSEDINIYIGNENEFEILRNFSLITLKNDFIGTIGIIGPTRMNYSKVVSVMNYINKKINESIGGIHNE